MQKLERTDELPPETRRKQFSEAQTVRRRRGRIRWEKSGGMGAEKPIGDVRM